MVSQQFGRWPFGPIVFLALIVYLIWTEIQSQDCQNRLCYNTTPVGSEQDTGRVIIDKMITTLRVNHGPVEWRKALLIGLFGSFIILIVLKLELNLSNFVLVGLIIFILVYFASTWTNWTDWRNVDTAIERGLLQLRSRG